MLAFWRVVLFLNALGLVFADTEIRNFRLPLPYTPPPWPPALVRGDLGARIAIAGSFAASDIIREKFTITSAQPELWVSFPFVEPGDWTARISWPASSPTQFDMDVLPARDGVELHFRARPLSPRMPHPLLEWLGWATPVELPPLDPTDADAGLDKQDFETEFVLVMEQLVYGVLPRTTLRAVWAIAIAVAFAAVVAAPFAIDGLDRLRAVEVEKEGKKE